jgi:predicted DCC family thiol-disulfide oxidoreductase YuxK
MERIIFFDGLCPFCHFWVQYLLKKDQNNQFLFAPLQGKIAHELLPSAFLSVDTIVLLEDKKSIYTKSDAILRIINILGGVKKILLVFKVIPPFIRNFLYDLFARNRFAIRKPLEHCPLPKPDVACRFLD